MTTPITVDSSHALYVQSIIKLMGSMVIKSQYTAEAINAALEEATDYVTPIDMTQWKYYQHLSGEYHSTDVNMIVVSIDTLETIIFNKEMLTYHKTTAEEYRYGSVYYEELVTRYPEQETLIRGILNPVDKQVAIDAEEGTILYHSTKLVEENEVSLIPDLQKWIKDFIYRWVNPGYVLIADLYWPDCLGRLYSFIPCVIYLLRLSKMKTDEAHSFHIWAHLASNGRMDLYKEYLTNKQRLYLYRNIGQLMSDAGTSETLEVLIQKFLTEMNIPAYTYDMVHDTENLLDTFKPKVMFEREALNSPISSGSNILLTPQELLQKEIGLARENNTSMVDDIYNTTRLAKNSKFDKLPTKIIETGVLDGAESNAVTHTTMVLNNWVYWSSLGLYVGTVQIDNPFSGELIQISPRDSFNLYFYLWCLANNVNVSNEVMQDYVAYDVLRTSDKPMKEWVDSFVNSKAITEVDGKQVMSVQPVIRTVSNLRDFISQSSKAYDCYNKCLMLSERKENLQNQLSMRSFTNGFFHDVKCDMNPSGETYFEMVTRLGIEVDELESKDLSILMDNTLVASVGDILSDTNSLVHIQSAMVDIVRQLSSYTLQFINQDAAVPSSNLPFYGHRQYDEETTVEYDLWDGYNVNMVNLALDVTSLTSGVNVTFDGLNEHDVSALPNPIDVVDVEWGHYGLFATGVAAGTPEDTYSFNDQLIQEQ